MTSQASFAMPRETPTLASADTPQLLSTITVAHRRAYFHAEAATFPRE